MSPKKTLPKKMPALVGMTRRNGTGFSGHLPKPTTKELKAAVAEVFDTPVYAGAYLTLHAGKTRVSGKGYLNAIGCRSLFASDPNIGFVQQDSYPGSIEVWLENVQNGDSFVVDFKVLCGHNGIWKISSSASAKVSIDIVPGYQTLSVFIPPVTGDPTMILLKLEPEFQAYGSWVFHEADVHKVTY